MDYFQLDHSQKLPAKFQPKHRITLEMQSVRQMQFASPLVALFFCFVLFYFLSLFPYFLFSFLCFLLFCLHFLPPSTSFTIRFHPKCLANKIKQTFLLDYDPPQIVLYKTQIPDGFMWFSSSLLFSTLFSVYLKNRKTNKQTNKQNSHIYPLFTQVPLISYTENQNC